MKAKFAAALIVTVILASSALVFRFFPTGKHLQPVVQANGGDNNGAPVQVSEPAEQIEAEKPKVPEQKEVKGIYVTGNSAGLESRFNSLINLINTTELNSMVIDVKDDNGEISYKSSIPAVIELGADKPAKIRDIHKVIDILNKNDIYPIARIVTFKDNKAATAKPQLAIKSKDGSVWRDNKGVAWLNPYVKEAWDYPISIAEEAADMGFKEIQFDYVRFPTDGNRSIIDYGQAGKDSTMAEAIANFLSYARERLNKKGVVVSADIYGLVTTVKDDMGIGQHLEDVAKSADVICPMVYPSHFAYGSYGIKYPDLEPYKTVSRSLSDAKQRLDAMPQDIQKAKIRPYLQDFTGSWLRPKNAYKQYTAADVRAQIKAAYDSGLKEWILWNAVNKYSEGALNKE
jgi:Uncharacterized conserved protein